MCVCSIPRDYALGRSKTRKLPDLPGPVVDGPATLGEMTGQAARQKGGDASCENDDLSKPLLEAEQDQVDEKPAAYSAPAFQPPVHSAR